MADNSTDIRQFGEVWGWWL